ncbi:endoglucanase type F [Fusarium phyllophilum]|uniref:Endoglucanase type F n=1 Tax=Fusarium phyllophilum TaxID=47803 RepID=A0A8H5ML29_9HYPO|nr:endoglucanase type F [Fusarium phyllophilum]
MRVSTISAIFSGLAVSATAQSDLDGSVWKALSAEPQSKRGFSDIPRNRPVKRQSGWNPPADLKAPLQEVWEHYEKTYNGGLDANVNTGFHQIMTNKGYFNICVRWDSSASITEAERTKIASAYNAQYQKWFKWLYGYNGFPYDEVKVNIVAYAVKDKSQLQGSTTGYEVYSELDADGVPIGCKAGADRHYDHSLWLKDGLEGGFGHNWGQEVGREYFMNNLDSDSIHILLHEMDHTFALDDFYDWTPTGITKFIMLAGASMEITDFDGWMYRNWWYYLSQKNNWSSGKVSTDAAPASSESKPTTKTAASITKTTAPKPSTTTKAIVSKPASTKKATATKAAAAQATSIETTASAEVAAWGQCGGNNWTGATKCTSGTRCIKRNEYYSQCVAN